MLRAMLIGLTGGIACGKTTVAGMLRSLGGIVIDADHLARDVVAPGSDGLLAVATHFGPWVLTDDGRLNRARLGEHVFAHPGERQHLEAIIHPLIAQESARQIQSALASSAPLVIYDAALLFESGRADAFRPVVVVYLEAAEQVRRLMNRDGLTREAASQRIDAQMPIAEKAALGDKIVDNGGSLMETRQRVEALWTELTNA
jgi:dephospho-CoA kinase